MKIDRTHPDAWSIRRAQSERRRRGEENPVKCFQRERKQRSSLPPLGSFQAVLQQKWTRRSSQDAGSAAGIGSPVCAAPTSALLAPLVHTGGRAALSQALSLRTRNPLSQSGVTQEDRELLVGGAKRGDETRPETCSPSDGPARLAVLARQ